MLAEAHLMKPLKIPKDIPVWIDRATRAPVGDIISLLSERHPDLLAVILYGSVARHEERPSGKVITEPCSHDELRCYTLDQG